MRCATRSLVGNAEVMVRPDLFFLLVDATKAWLPETDRPFPVGRASQRSSPVRAGLLVGGALQKECVLLEKLSLRQGVFSCPAAFGPEN
jgi:hypothetical protein